MEKDYWNGFYDDTGAPIRPSDFAIFIEKDFLGKLLELYSTTIEIKDDGSHLYNTWHMLRHHFIYFPWFDKNGMILSHTKKEFTPKKINNLLLNIINNDKSYFLFLKKLLYYDLYSDLKKIKSSIYFINESVSCNKNNNLIINNKKNNFFIDKYSNYRKLINMIEKNLS